MRWAWLSSPSRDRPVPLSIWLMPIKLDRRSSASGARGGRPRQAIIILSLAQAGAEHPRLIAGHRTDTESACARDMSIPCAMLWFAMPDQQSSHLSMIDRRKLLRLGSAAALGSGVPTLVRAGRERRESAHPALRHLGAHRTGGVRDRLRLGQFVRSRSGAPCAGSRRHPVRHGRELSLRLVRGGDGQRPARRCVIGWCSAPRAKRASATRRRT